MIDTILDLTDRINLFARIEAFAGGLFRRRQPCAVIVDRNTSQRSGSDCMNFLKERGVRCWAGRASGKEFVFYVSKQQYVMATSLLMGIGVPLVKVPAGAKPMKFNTLWKDGPQQPRRKAGKRRFLGWLG